VIVIEPTRDLALIRSIATHPKIWREGILEDGLPAKDAYQVSPDFLYLLPKEHESVLGAFAVKDLGLGVHNTHIALLPHAWGRSVDCVHAFFEWMRANTKADFIVGDVPEFNSLSKALCRRVGMFLLDERHGLITKDGKPQVMIRFCYRLRA
jgi:hypothetical protein